MENVRSVGMINATGARVQVLNVHKAATHSPAKAVYLWKPLVTILLSYLRSFQPISFRLTYRRIARAKITQSRFYTNMRRTNMILKTTTCGPASAVQTTPTGIHSVLFADEIDHNKLPASTAGPKVPSWSIGWDSIPTLQSLP